MSAVGEKIIRNVEDPGRIEGPHAVSGALVQQSLTEIFQSAPFRASRQSRELLGYIVDQTLAGHGESLKERLIGVNVFGRRPDYDTSEDPIVRARAAEVRKRLAQFYLGEGSHSAFRIEISPGSYLASFVELPRINPAESNVYTPLTIEPARKEPSIQILPGNDRKGIRLFQKKRLPVWLTTLCGLILSLAASYWFWVVSATPINVFWKPFVTSPSPVLLYSGANAVYMLSTEFLSRYEASHHLDPLESQGREYVVPMSPDMKLQAADLVGYKNEFVTLGDLSANVRVASLLALHRSRFELRSGEDVAFSDLRESPTVLIGGFNNSWTMKLTGDLPFIFDRGLTIRDQINNKRVWNPVFLDGGKVAVDYSVVTRMPRSKTGESLISIAGITQSGTRAAAEFITDPKQVKDLVATLPRDWPQKNLQFVIQTKVVNDIPTFPVVVAVKSW